MAVLSLVVSRLSAKICDEVCALVIAQTCARWPIIQYLLSCMPCMPQVASWYLLTWSYSLVT